MLLRNNNSTDEAGQDIYLNMTSSASLNTQQADEDLDFDSITSNTRTTEQSTSIYHTGHETHDSTSPGMNDDIWGDDEDSSSQPTGLVEHQQISDRQSGQRSVNVSDIPRLKQEHTTAGYRDGVTIAKAASVQAGFDEGYGLGATIGAQAGRLLGLLSGLVGALSSSSASVSHSGTGSAASSGSGVKDGQETRDEKETESKRLQALLETATKELSVLSIFGEEYFARDGIWKYEVVRQSTGQAEGGDAQQPEVRTKKEETAATEKAGDQKEEEAIVFADIAASHPLLRKWDEIVNQEAGRYGLVWDVLLPEEDHDEEKEDEKSVSIEKGKDKNGKKPAAVSQNRGALAW